MIKFISSLLGTKSPAFIWLVTRGQGKRVGEDQFGNVYYSGKPRPGYKQERRWVIYKGTNDSSIVPPEWHGWLHHQSDIIPTETRLSYRKNWQKPAQPNLTGRDSAYFPPGHIKAQSGHAPLASHYEAWTPE